MTRRLKERSRRPIIVKLSPNVTDIVELARAAEEGGADALTVANTFLAMAIDTEYIQTANPYRYRRTFRPGDSSDHTANGLSMCARGEDSGHRTWRDCHRRRRRRVLSCGRVGDSGRHGELLRSTSAVERSERAGEVSQKERTPFGADLVGQMKHEREDHHCSGCQFPRTGAAACKTNCTTARDVQGRKSAVYVRRSFDRASRLSSSAARFFSISSFTTSRTRSRRRRSRLRSWAFR